MGINKYTKIYAEIEEPEDFPDFNPDDITIGSSLEDEEAELGDFYF